MAPGALKELALFAASCAAAILVVDALFVGPFQVAEHDHQHGLAPVEISAETGLLPLPENTRNRPTAAGIELGRRLFHDPILSLDRTLACAGCHAQAFAFSDNNKRLSIGVDGASSRRNAPIIVNIAWAPSFFWDGRAPTAAEQARVPVAHPNEMKLPWDEALRRLAVHATYPALFEEAFGSPGITEDRVVLALEQFELTLISNGSKWDRVQRGEATFTASEARGEQLFFTDAAECFHCHPPPLWTDHRFHDIGLDAEPTDPGRGEVTGNRFDIGRFKTPSLRNSEVSGPYMHDGRFATLEAVVDHYAEGVARSPNLDPLLGIRPEGLGLDAGQKADLVAFLKTLTDHDFLSNPDFGPPD